LLQPGDFTRKQKRTRADSVSAQVILQDFLDSLGHAGNAGSV
jgi:RNase H-fold protein (predicted Holliday junction resolvase)